MRIMIEDEIGRARLLVAMRRSGVAGLANEALVGARCQHTAPRLTSSSDRETLIGWLCCVDGNGVWTDDDMRAEGWDPMSLQDAWDQIAAMTDQIAAVTDQIAASRAHCQEHGHGCEDYHCEAYRNAEPSPSMRSTVQREYLDAIMSGEEDFA